MDGAIGWPSRASSPWILRCPQQGFSLASPTHLTPEQLEHLEELVTASRLRAARSPSPKPPPTRRRSRQYPGGRPNPWRVARLRRRHG
ncbi:hypothetical protein [Streptomyces sp. LN549]|uniref:hypothetical protein n=1 Tax=Streptomyces sp. LN549 TaxID=3112979 RepID=UPI00371D9E0F